MHVLVRVVVCVLTVSIRSVYEYTKVHTKSGFRY